MIDFSKIKSKKEVGKCFDYAILPETDNRADYP